MPHGLRYERITTTQCIFVTLQYRHILNVPKYDNMAFAKSAFFSIFSVLTLQKFWQVLHGIFIVHGSLDEHLSYHGTELDGQILLLLRSREQTHKPLVIR